MSKTTKFPEDPFSLIEICDIKSILTKVANGDPENLLRFYKSESERLLDIINKYIEDFQGAIDELKKECTTDSVSS